MNIQQRLYAQRAKLLDESLETKLPIKKQSKTQYQINFPESLGQPSGHLKQWFSINFGTIALLVDTGFDKDMYAVSFDTSDNEYRFGKVDKVKGTKKAKAEVASKFAASIRSVFTQFIKENKPRIVFVDIPDKKLARLFIKIFNKTSTGYKIILSTVSGLELIIFKDKKDLDIVQNIQQRPSSGTPSELNSLKSAAKSFFRSIFGSK